jgi:hypothetical protein
VVDRYIAAPQLATRRAAGLGDVTFRRVTLLGVVALSALPVGVAPAGLVSAAVDDGDADIDGDRRADVVIGSPGEPSGAVYVRYGDGATQPGGRASG